MAQLKISPFACLVTLLFSAACATTSGTEPHDMSASDHQAAAAAEEQKADDHAAQHDPNASVASVECAEGRGRVCWTDVTNPTDEHNAQAEQHKELAAKHRSASQALIAAEQQACGGIDDADRDMSPFEHGADIASVSKLEEDVAAGKSTLKRAAGATIVVRAVKGLTAEWLQRVVDCHLARNAAVGHEMPEMPGCPLVPVGAKAKVRSTGDGFAVDVSSDNAAGADEIWKRAQLLAAAH
jgi:hypothetical protein